MKPLLAAIVLAALAWSGVWFWQAHAQRQAIDAWAASRAADGVMVHWDDVAVKGFPNRIDTSFTGLRSEGDGLTLETPQLMLMQMVWNRDHIILALPQGASLSSGEEVYHIDGDGLRASIVSDDGRMQRLHVEAAVLNLSGGVSAAMSGVTGAVTLIPEEPAYHATFNAAELALQDSLGSGGLRLDATVGVTQAGQADITRIRLARLELDQGALQLAATGDVDVTEGGVLDGKLSVRAENLAEALEAERKAGRIAPAMLAMIEQGAALLSGLSGRKDSIDATFEFRNGRTWVGILPIGPAPQLR
ncbi:DUF2125 domain-containing protein [Salipiger sp. 1_MG-2023]|uniref:DUF2125 domain-containing protein n=1 Tax=Salipiger sp. 1_MG-2023 TaxID=3062665 RepID=UPI0026E45BBC|nr:DUF2125 domain-containing protein [Salipiger sp. 1_MG-2023]MDO6585979.1 DUF2125 domain-containing protein [Salipiger sp. 1_MG-2023]